jgi:hypothetical protein
MSGKAYENNCTCYEQTFENFTEDKEELVNRVKEVSHSIKDGEKKKYMNQYGNF